MADLTIVTSRFSDALLRGDGAYFLGSGVSVPSHLPDWSGLLQPFATTLGLTLQLDDDLPLIAQHVVNSAVGNRGPLVGEFRRRLGGRHPLNRYHEALQLTNVRTIWTTNFDTLVEDALTNAKVAVRASDADLTSGPDDHEIEVLKMHGCIRRSSPQQLVITTEDYEDFAIQRAAFAQRLRHDLLHRTLLFVGYSYRDPNIRTLLVEARRLAQRATREHLMLLRRETSSAGEELRQRLWTIDLGRVGIRCVLADSYAEIEEALSVIARQSRGRSVFTTGSHAGSSPLAAEVGKLLAGVDPPILMLDGQSSGTSRQVMDAFGTACVIGKKDFRTRIRYFPNPYSVNASFASDPAHLDTLKQWRATLLRATRTMLVFDGGMGTEAEVALARNFRCQIIPVPERPGDLSTRLLQEADIEQHLRTIDPAYLSKATSGPSPRKTSSSASSRASSNGRPIST